MSQLFKKLNCYIQKGTEVPLSPGHTFSVPNRAVNVHLCFTVTKFAAKGTSRSNHDKPQIAILPLYLCCSGCAHPLLAIAHSATGLSYLACQGVVISEGLSYLPPEDLPKSNMTRRRFGV